MVVMSALHSLPIDACSFEHERVNNGQMQDRRLIPQGERRRYTGEILLRTRPKTYHAIARELAEPNASVNGISRRYRVSNHTVMGIRAHEAKT